MSIATTPLSSNHLDKLQYGNPYRSHTSVRNTCRISWNFIAKNGYCDRIHSFSIYDQWRAHHTIRMELNAGKDNPPEEPAPPSRRASTFIAGAYGGILTIFTVILPLSTSGKWGPLLAFTKKLNSTMELVEDVTEAIEDIAELVDEITDKVTEQLPEDSKLKHILDKIDDAAEQTIRATDFAQDILEKVEDVQDSMEIVIEKLMNTDSAQEKRVVDVEMKMEREVGKLIYKHLTRDKNVADIEKNMEIAVEQLLNKVEAHEKKIFDIEMKIEKLTKQLSTQEQEHDNKKE